MASIPVDENGNPIQAQAAGAGGKSIPVDENGKPIAPPQGWGDYLTGNAEAGSKLLARGAISKVMAPFDMLVTGARALGGESDKLGLTSPTPELGPLDTWLSKHGIPENTGNLDNNGQVIGGADAPLPSQALIGDVNKAVPIAMDKNAGPAMRFADIVAPLALNSVQSGIANASSVPGAVWGGIKELGSQGVGAAASTGAGWLAHKLGADDLGTFVAQLVAGGAGMKAAQAAGAKIISDRFADPNAGQTMADAEALGVKPTPGMLMTPQGKMLETNVAANPFVGGELKRQMAETQNVLDQRIGEEAGKVGGYGGPLAQPRKPESTGQDLITNAQTRQAALDQAQSAAQQAVEDKIVASGALPETSPVVDAITKITKGPDFDPTSVGPLNTRLASLEELQRRQNPPPVELPPDYAQPTTTSYPGFRDWNTNLGRNITAVGPIDPAHRKLVYPAGVEALRGAASEAGVGPDFDAAQALTRTMHQEQFPLLEKFGGELSGVGEGGQPRFAGTPSAGGATNIFEHAASAGGDPALMEQIIQHMPPEPVNRALADTVRNAGRRSGDFRLEHFSPAWEDVNQPAREAMGAISSGTPETLDRVSRLSDVYLRKPERPGLTDTLGIQAALAQLPGGIVGKTLGGLALFHGLNSPTMINALAGRQWMAPLITEYLRNLPVQQQLSERALGAQR